MTEVGQAVPGSPGEDTLIPKLPRNRTRRQRMTRVAIWIGGLALFVLVLQLLGVDVTGWLSSLWDQMRSIPRSYTLPALVFQLATRSWPASPTTGSCASPTRARSSSAPILTAYAVGVAMNGFLPANIGTFVTLVMFVAIIPSATLAGSIAAYLVQKIFFTLAGTFVFLYMFLSVRTRST